ncbi:putative ammonium transporter 3 [Parasteatoda tepidariorum]|uniref:putative ammonium transporter 3 n=1 Tax=Parasteatoda tepidariorum TaxID=114398 RepID=UPI00077FD216|nr:putative ammonium transporter 3 [Parasteatoda tepidariorum]
MPSVSETDSPFMNGTLSDEQASRKDANDVVFILTSSFLIFTMQSGYALLESGIVSRKNEVNILVKNATNVLTGGFAYWAFGFALSYGKTYSNLFIAVGSFFITATPDEMGVVYSKFVFELAYATTATTLVSGAMAERCKFTSYCFITVLGILVYSIPAGWMWRENGLLASLGAVDVGGSGVVHLVGGSCGLVAAIILGPRTGRYDRGTQILPLGNPTNALLGLFMLWWGWLGFSAGSTTGIVDNKWKYSSRASVTTILASTGGGLVGMIFSYFAKDGIHDVAILMNAVMGSLVAISGGCTIVRPWESIVIGMVAGLIVLFAIPLIDRLHIDDPTNTFAVHGTAGAWGLLAIGLFSVGDNMKNYTRGLNGLFKGGGWRLFGAQALSCGVLFAWSFAVSAVLFYAVDKTVGLRMPLEEEVLGPDYVDHCLKHDGNSKIIEKFKARKRRMRRF